MGIGRVVAAVVLQAVLLAPTASALHVADGAGQRASTHSTDPGVARRSVAYVLPVDGAVVRGFDASDPYGPGHRGVDLEAAAGSAVHAAAGGIVVFAGTVAGTRWVTVAHDDGIRTSYGHLGTVAVAVGQALPAGAVVGTAAGELSFGRPHVHWGARDERGYVDPLALLRPPVVRVALDAPATAGIVVAR